MCVCMHISVCTRLLNLRSKKIGILGNAKANFTLKRTIIIQGLISCFSDRTEKNIWKENYDICLLSRRSVSAAAREKPDSYFLRNSTSFCERFCANHFRCGYFCFPLASVALFTCQDNLFQSRRVANIKSSPWLWIVPLPIAIRPLWQSMFNK